MAIRKPTTAATKTGPLYDAMAAALDQTMNQFTVGSIIKGTVSGIKGNEVFVDIGYKSEGVVSINEFEDPTQIKTGDEIDVLLEQLESDSGMVVLSKSRADEKLRWDAVLAKYTEGGVVTGTIRNKVRGGLIVNVDGVDAFLPGSQVDVTPVHDPDPYLGTTSEFKVIKISNERRNIIVSRRELIEERLAEKKRELLGTIEKGQMRHGRVKNITDFGAFVDLDGLDGLLHITDMSWGRIKHPNEMLKVGDELDVIILEVDMERERVSLGLKQATPNPWDNIGDTYLIRGTISATPIRSAAVCAARWSIWCPTVLSSRSSPASKVWYTSQNSPGPSAWPAPLTCSALATRSTW